MRGRSQADRREAMIGERLMWPTGPVRGLGVSPIAYLTPIFPCFDQYSLVSDAHYRLFVIKPRSRASESVAREVSRRMNPALGFRSGRQRRGKIQRKARDGCAINNAR